MAFESSHLRDAFLIELAEVMAGAGEDRAQREAAARRAYPDCPISLIRDADRKAIDIIEFEFLRPLAANFADQVAAREREAAADRGRRLPSMSSGHLDRDIPF